MQLIEWMDIFSVGHPGMDGDHQALLAILNRVYDAWTLGGHHEDVATVFDELLAYTRTHFAHEEALLAKAGYPRLAVQKREHAAMISALKAFGDRHLSGDAPARLTEDMVAFLRSWMIDHILQEDMLYKPLFAKAVDDPPKI